MVIRPKTEVDLFSANGHEIHLEEKQIHCKRQRSIL
jgi:hypothetical protein